MKQFTDSFKERQHPAGIFMSTFRFIENTMNVMTLKVMGKKRTQGLVGLINLVYNLLR
jgi:hypothetical protein